MEKFNLIIIGGGRAINLANYAASKGYKVAVIEKSTLGGTCPNRGCIPSKLLIGYANVIRNIQNADRHFISSKIDHIDTRKIFNTNNSFISFIGHHIEANVVRKDVKVFKGKGSFVSDKEVLINGEVITSDKIVIATGTRPRGIVHEKAWSSDDIFPLREELPRSITIIGAGFIGVEIANFFDAIGVKTTLISRTSKLLEREDEDISEVFKTQFTKNVDVRFNTRIQKIEEDNHKFKLYLATENGEDYIHETEKIFDATGRIPNSEDLNLDNTSIRTNKFGYVETDEFCMTAAKDVYAIGDVAGRNLLQHAASFEAKYLTGLFYEEKKEPLSFKYMAHAVFSSPEIASVGVTEQDLKNQNIDYVTTTTKWSYSGKFLSLRLDDYPRTKFIVNPKTYEILGCHLIGPESSVMIHQVLAVMQLDNDIRHLREMMYIHPALNEEIMIAAIEVINKIEALKN